MKNISSLLLSIVLCFCISFGAQAEKVQGAAKSPKTIKSNAAGCAPGAGYKMLQVNNVSCRINTGGDMWWDFENPMYEIPAGSNKTSMFSAGLWIGGIDSNFQLKLAAVRFRQGPAALGLPGGNDYWPGPLTMTSAEVTPSTCLEYDKLFYMSQDMVSEFLSNCDPTTGIYDPSLDPDYSIPSEIMNWPAHGNTAADQSYYLAPFYDNDGDGNYDPTAGDYPYYDLSNTLCPSNYAGDTSYKPAVTMEGNGILVDQVIKGDETLWWVFNDKGNIHTETFGAQIGFEIRAQAFAFSSNDEINNMTFYSYEIINRSSYLLTDTYFSQWVDTDLGYAKDDYVGCDVLRGLGYCYNGSDRDGNGQYNAYGNQPPAIGVDFFQGPYLDADGYDNPAFYGDGLKGPSYNGNNTANSALDCSIVTQDGYLINFYYGDGPQEGSQYGQFLVNSAAINGVNFGNGIVDDERFGMRRFVYHNNGGADYMTDPNYAADYYNLLRGLWLDNTKMKYGGNAHVSSGAEDIETDFMFPGDSDPCLWGTKGVQPQEFYWTEVTAGNKAEDRRFMQSAGPFELLPGQVNYITVGIPWARATAGGAWASVELLRTVDDKCQALFDNCFAVVNGPNAPDLTIRELENSLVIYISNRKTNDTGNNFGEKYIEVDPYIATLSNDTLFYDSAYRFEGYVVYQLVDSEASISDLGDESKIRQIFQCDVKNGVTKLVNFTYNNTMEANVPAVMVDGKDAGIVHSITVTTDAFDSQPLINHKSYYFTAIAYGYNQYKKYSDQPDQWIVGECGIDGQKEPFLSGRKNITTYEAIPHKPLGGLVINSTYGDQPPITRVQGHGNGGFVLMLENSSIDAIMDKNPITYKMTDDGNLVIEDYGSGTEIYPGRIIAEQHVGEEDYPISYELDYKKNYGPLAVKVIDPLNVVKANYELKFDSMYRVGTENVSGDTRVPDTASKLVAGWVLTDLDSGKRYTSDTSTIFQNEQLFLDLGISITLEQSYFTKIYDVGSFGEASDLTHVYSSLVSDNGLLYSNIAYADSSDKWLSGLADIDEDGPYNWIRCGENVDPDNPKNNDWNMATGSAGTPTGIAYDGAGVYEKVAGSAWTPYMFVAHNDQSIVGPAYTSRSRQWNQMQNIYSVDIVFTSDKSKWTRCPVVEMCSDNALSEGGQSQYMVRRSASVDKYGNKADPNGGNNYTDPEAANYISATGMGWFPGYAINIETGERLNMMFAEDSWLVGENGRDMKWNPTANIVLDMYKPYTTYTNPPSSALLFGGKHYVYVFGCNKGVQGGSGVYHPIFDSPAYDAGLWAHHSLSYEENIPVALLTMRRDAVYANVMWVGLPLVSEKYSGNTEQTYLDNKATVQIRINRPYERYFSNIAVNDTVTETEYNRFFPAYKFSTEAIATEKGVEEILVSELDDISVVPNPYYGLSDYDATQLDNRVKIVNLPNTCTITIFNAAVQLIRQYTKSSEQTYQDWDLKNSKNIPISSGMYLIHVSAPGIGERTLKWFGALRPVDLNTF